jgi:transposase-like protein
MMSRRCPYIIKLGPDYSCQKDKTLKDCLHEACPDLEEILRNRRRTETREWVMKEEIICLRNILEFLPE